DLVEQAAADDQHGAARMFVRGAREEVSEVALERRVIERPRKFARALVVREVVGLLRVHRCDHQRSGLSPASATIRYSYACGESTGPSGSETAQRTSLASGAIAASGRKR